MSFLNLNWIKENFTNDKFVFFEIGCAHLDTSCKLRELMPAAEIYAFDKVALANVNVIGVYLLASPIGKLYAVDAAVFTKRFNVPVVAVTKSL